MLPTTGQQTSRNCLKPQERGSRSRTTNCKEKSVKTKTHFIALLMLAFAVLHADNNSRTALWWAVVRKRIDIAELLKAAGAQ